MYHSQLQQIDDNFRFKTKKKNKIIVCKKIRDKAKLSKRGQHSSE